jgi:DNA-binding NtrC family response regulator
MGSTMNMGEQIITTLIYGDKHFHSEILKYLPPEENFDYFLLEPEPDNLIPTLERKNIRILILPFQEPLSLLVDILKKVKNFDPLLEIIIVGQKLDTEIKVQLLNQGASVYVETPLSREILQRVFKQILKKFSIRRATFQLEKKLEKKYSFYGIISKNPYMLEIFSLIEKIANHFTTILITGETGTGKEMIARAIRQLCRTPNKELVICDCTAIPENLFESELFGYKKGAFTGATQDKIGLFALADQGIIFLDEIGEIPFSIQTKLLRVIEYHEFRPLGASKVKKIEVKVIAATSRNLREDVEKGRFREDLFHRLNKIEIHLPPLRERPDDIPLLVRHFLEIFNEKFNKNIKGVSRNVQKLFLKYDWPGNIRELENVLERAVLVTSRDFIDLPDLPEYLQNYLPLESGIIPLTRNKLASLDELEKEYIIYLLKKTNNNLRQTARILNISRTTLYHKIKKYNIPLQRSNRRS